ncbi:GntR family transcriptional regulator [Gorillibacterium timonense]|uniref:GntR family transcriptional regulator n=1 Tax=Gorillibacterium timonense TaxID=1689269 RepID=UPI0021CBBFB3|nr:GntR family transcriptional regulator [Gorillibacterium timonense]
MTLDFGSDLPLYLQLRNQIVLGIGAGELGEGERLPTVRQLAEDLGINPMTVNKAYAELKQEGFIEIDRRRGAVVRGAEPLSGAAAEAFQVKLEKDLKLVISEAMLRGMRKPDFIRLCSAIFAGMPAAASGIGEGME